jgi:biotin operon repressor
MIEKRITILRIRKPRHVNLNQELQWFGSSLGLFNLRDKDSSCFRVFIELLKATKTQISLSSDDLADLLDLSRGTVVHHLNKLKGSGIVIHQGKRYMLRDQNLKKLITDIRKDMIKSLLELEKVAAELDDMLGL